MDPIRDPLLYFDNKKGFDFSNPFIIYFFADFFVVFTFVF